MTSLTITRGDDATLDVAATHDGEPVDLTGAIAWWTAKARQSDADVDAVITKSTHQGGVTITDGPGGIAEVSLVPADTAGLANSVALWWDFQVLDGAGKVRTMAAGRLVVNQDITRTTSAPE